MNELTSFSPDLLEFLIALEKNNNRDWFNDKKEDYKILEKNAKSGFKYLFDQMKTHDDVNHLKNFRIYRDVRFSKNKLPYKIHFSGSIQRRKPELRGGYYLHIQPKDKSYIASGFWDPSKEDLFRIRKEFEADDQEIRDITSNPQLKKIWGNFAGDELKTAPKGFDKTHPAIDLIRKKQFIFIKPFGDEQVLAKGFLNEVNDAFITVRPFFDYMSDVLTTDINGEPLT